MRGVLDRLFGRRAPAAAADPAEVAALVEAERLRRQAQAERLRGILKGTGAPDVLPAAIRSLATGPREVRARHMLQFWHGAPTPDVARMIELTRTACAARGIEHVLFDEAGGRAALEAVAPEALAHYDRAFHPAMKADILRLHWLHAHGGWWCDADLAVTADVPDALPAHTLFFAETTVGNSVLFTAPQRPLYRLILRRMHERLERYFARWPDGPHFPEDVIVLTGPRFLRAPINEYFAGTEDDSVRFAPRAERAAFVRVAVEVLGRAIDYKAAGGAWHGKAGPLDAAGKAARRIRLDARDRG
jgi:hypothetical protein